MVIAMRSRLLCIAALVTSLGTMCFADTLRVMSFNVRYPAKSDGANALESTKLRGVLKELLAVQKAVAEAHNTP